MFLWQLGRRCACWPVHHTWRFCWLLPGSPLHLPLWQCRQCVILQSIWDSDIPGHWLASGPWDQSAAVWAFPILQNQIRRFLCCRNLRHFHSSSQNIIHGAVSLLPRRAFTAEETVQSPCIDWLSTDAGVWLACLTAKSLSHC